jgi:anionic cell wall polymer biosynthesis LytR-Cps2A-Psr (LCP) family protein
MEKELKKRRIKYFSKYKKRKTYFWLTLCCILILSVSFYLTVNAAVNPQRLIRVGICGAINRPAVYTMREGSDLSMLVLAAHGFTPNADIQKLNLDNIVYNDSIYHIPAQGGNNYSKTISFMKEVNKSINTSFKDVSKEITAKSDDKQIKQYSILYVGLPAVYVLINYYPEFHRINFVHIPHSAVFLYNKYRLSDLFFTMGIHPTMRILENRLKQKIDFYMIQDRFAFIDLIDRLGGVDINLDKEYAKEYELNAGQQNIDGFHAWEYIRFLDWKNLKLNARNDKTIDLIQKDNFQAEPKTWERIYETRNQRQRYVLLGMRKSFIGLSLDKQLDVIQNIHNEFTTDMTNEFLMELYSDLLSTRNFAFGSLPGYYKSEGNNLYFYPDLPNFDMLRKQEVRKLVETTAGKEQTIY